ncbi:MAG: DUF2062 domain-containing protein [Blastocatellia bacterium]
MSRRQALLQSWLQGGESPERIALALALGVAVGFSPLLGLQTLLALGLASLLGLNRWATLAGSYLNNPWTMGLVVAASWWVGSWVVEAPRVELPLLTWYSLGEGAFWRGLASQWRQLYPYAIGATLFSILGGLLTYPVMVWLLRSVQRRLISPPMEKREE